MDNNIFENLIVLDIANNHQGDLNHGLNIIREHGEVVKKLKAKAAIKFQFRDLPNFVHVSERENKNNKHVNRFLSTHISWEEFSLMQKECKKQNLLTMCTPFDERSVEKIIEMNFDIIKVASCSANDWPLLDKVASSGLPIVVSTGGLMQSQVDAVVSFFTHKACNFALMHCVSIYPTPDHECNILNISKFVERYPDINIGWSTHESPDDTLHVGLALAAGATMFERHIGIPLNDVPLNKYSSNPQQVANWLNSLVRSRNILGSRNREKISADEISAINDLKRGVYSLGNISKGTSLDLSNVAYSFPCREGQISSGEFLLGSKIKHDIQSGSPIMIDSLELSVNKAKKLELILKHSIHEVKAMLAEAKITLGNLFQTEYSHHYGIENFRKVGAVLITVVNRSYAKKILIQLPGQKHPSHMHRLKEETFVVLNGSIDFWIEGKHQYLQAGDQLTVLPGTWHEFQSKEGCIVEEISSTAHKGDSIYKDDQINQLTSEQRKTEVDNWGRFQIAEQLKNQLIIPNN